MQIKKSSLHYKLYSSAYWIFALASFIVTCALAAILWSLCLVLFLFNFLFTGSLRGAMVESKIPIYATGIVGLFELLFPMRYISGQLPEDGTVGLRVGNWRLPPTVILSPLALGFFTWWSPVAFWVAASLCGAALLIVTIVLSVKKIRQSENLRPFLTYLKDKKDGVCRKVEFVENAKS